MASDDWDILEKLATELAVTEISRTDAWTDSPFAWIRQLSSAGRGRVGAELATRFFAAHGFDVRPSPSPEADRIVNGRPAEIKFSMRWEQGLYCFQQLRDQRYELAILLGVCPHEAHCWSVPKNVLLENADLQHAGVHGHDTRWVRFRPASPPEWLEPYGGSLEACVQKLRELAAR